MRHRVAGRRLNRSSGHRKALRRNLITELFRHERIRTTQAKASAVRGAAEKLITSAKRSNAAGDEAKIVHARRLAKNRLSDPEMVKKLFDEIAPRYTDRPGGYTRILKLGPRAGDAAEMVLLELVEE
ncbi:MAG: 50S ribosomal protein L17 [Anaerolineales bacterium]|nr:50S ribosomal protein L17 [Anaerolineales bacterium]